MKYMATVLLLVIALVGSGVAQENTRFINVISFKWTTTHNVLTFSWPGHAETSCNTRITGSVDMSGRISDSGNVDVSGDVNATGTTNCSTTYTPPSETEIDLQKPVIYILVDGESSRMILTCSRNSPWSQCVSLTPGMHESRDNHGHFEVLGLKNGKAGWVKYDIVKETAFSQQDQKEMSDLKQKMDDEICPGVANVMMRFLARHPELGAGFSSEQQQAQGAAFVAYFDDNHLDACSEASWNQAYEALKNTSVFKLK